MKCPKCQFDNREGATFCKECGNELELACPKCGNMYQAGSKFCDKCGHDLRRPSEAVSALRRGDPGAYTPKHLADKIRSTRPTIEGERKQVTVLFADVSSFTSISEKLDPEEVHMLMNRCLEFFMDEIHRYEGTITQFTGDGVMALFGAPIAHEDAPQRALYAALGIQRSLSRYAEELKKEQGIEFQMRIGVNTGPVVVGKIGDDLTMEYTAMGDTVNLAARMEQIAEPGAILVAEATHRLTEGYFEFKPLGEVEVKGRKESVKTYQVLGLGPVRTRLEAAMARGLTPFVGRKRELEHLAECFARLKEGQGQVVGIVGEAGVGKSRLLLQLRGMLPREGYTYLEGLCLHYGGSWAYQPLLDMLRSYFNIEEGEREFVVKRKMEKKVVQLDEKLKGILPPLHDVLSLKVEDEEYLKLEPQQKREKTFEAIRSLLITEGQNRPVILAVEDLHWIDKTTEEFLTYLIGGLPNTRILLLLLYRPEYTHTWASKSYYSQVGVDQFSTETSAEMVNVMLEGAEVVPQLRELILNRAAGNPLFMEEFTHTLVENGSIQREEHQYVLSREASDIEVPDTIQGIIAARMDRLEESLKRTMQVASVIGRDFAFRILQTITGMQEELKSYLLDLQALEFIYEKSLFPELEYVFKHGLTQEVAYNSLLLQRRKEFHRRIGEAIEQLYGERIEEYYPILAHHYRQGEDLEKALQYLTLAGDRAWSLHSTEECVYYYEGALEVLSKLPDNLENKRKGLEIRLALWPPLMFLGYYAERLFQVLKEAEEIALEIEDRNKLIEVYGGLTMYFFVSADMETALKYGEKNLAAAEEVGDIVSIASSAAWLASTYFNVGQFRRSIAHFQRAIDLQETTPVTIEVMGMPGVPLAFAFIARQCIALGEYDDALEYAEKGLQMAEEINDPFGQAWCQFQRGLCWVWSGRPDWEKGIEYLERAIPLWKQVGWLLMELWTYAGLGHAYYFIGDTQKRRDFIDKSNALRELAGSNVPEYLRLLADICLGLGETQKALECCEEGLSIALNDKSKWHEWASRQGLGEVYTAMGPPYYEEAEKHFLDSIRLAEEEDARPDVAKSCRGLGILYKEKGQPEKAREYLSRAITMFEEMGMMRDLPRAREALDSLE